MANLRDLMVRIGADTSSFERSMNSMEREIENVSRQLRSSTSGMTTSMNNLGNAGNTMSQKMRNAYMESRKQLEPFQQQLQQTEFKFFELSQSMGKYEGSTKSFMSQLHALGSEHKKITDNMIKNNDMLKQGFIQSIGVMAARSTQSEKIAQNFTRMGNPLLTVNNGLLAVTNGMEKMAKAGQPAALALKMLGPNANMKELLDMTRLISQGLIRFQGVALVAAAASAILYTSLFKAAKGPDPSEVYRKQADALAEYSNAVDQRTREIMSAWGLFEKVQLDKTNPNTLIQNLSDQVKTLQGWRMNLATISQRAGSDFANSLAEMGPQAAAEVATISQMTDPELTKYVDLWKQKMIHARMEAMTELEKLKAETDKKVKALQATLTPLGLALEPLKATWAEAFKPMVEVFGMVMTPLVNFLTKIGEMVVAFNTAHPVLAKIIQGFLMLIPILTLILAPLAIGIGLFGGLQAAFASIWMIIGPVVIGFASLLGTVLLVSAAIVGLVAVFMYLWNTNEGFKNAIIAGWQAIQAAAASIWNSILNGVLIPIWNAIVSFGMQIWGQFQSFWQQNGDNIMQIAQAVWSFVRDAIITQVTVIVATLTVLWNVLSSVVKAVWSNIKGIISGALDIILGVVGVFVSLLTGDWKGVWENVKRITQGAWSVLANLVTFGINVVLGLIRGLGSSIGGEFGKIANSFYNAGKGFMDMLVKGINSAVGAVLSTVESIAGKIRAFLPFSPAKEGPLSDLDHLDFGGPISDSLKKGVPMIRGLMGDMLSLPPIAVAASDSGSATSSNSPQNVTLVMQMDGRTVAEGVYPWVDLFGANSARMAQVQLGMKGGR